MSTIRVCLSALGVCLLLGVARAQAPADDVAPVGMTVRSVTGPRFTAKPRHFVAVHVLLESTADEDLEGVLRVYRSQAHEDPAAEQGLFYERIVDLPRGSNRAETVYYYCQDQEPDHQLAVVFELSDGRATPVTFPQFELARHTLQLLALSSRPADGALGMLRAATVRGSRRFWRIDPYQADLEALPGHMAGYDPFDAVLITDLDPDALDGARAEALRDWVGAGGELLVCFTGSAGQLDSSALAELLPVELTRSTSVRRSLSALRGLTGSSAGFPSGVDDAALVPEVTLRPGAVVLAGDEQAPLVVRGRFGAGVVTYLAFPWDAAPLRAWSARGDLGDALLRPPAQDLELPQKSPPPSAPPLEELALNVSEALETLTPPSVLLVAPLLMLYVLLVSPVTYKLLQRRQRLNWAKPVGLGVTLVFVVVFYGIGRAYKSSEAQLTHVALIDLAVTPGPSRIEQLTGYFSTRQGLSSAEGQDGAVIAPVAGQRTNREALVRESEGAWELQRVTLDTWAQRKFRSLSARDVGYLEVDLEVRKNVVVGSLVNHTDYLLEDMLLLVPGGLLEVGRLEAGESAPVGGPWVLRERAYRAGSIPLIRRLLNETQSYAHRYGAIADLGFGTDPYGGSDARRVLDMLDRRLGAVPTRPMALPALLVAQVSDAPEGVVLDESSELALARSYVFVETEVRIAEGQVELLGLPGTVAGPARGLSFDRPVVSDFYALSGPAGSAPRLSGNPLSAGVVEYQWRLPSQQDRPLALNAGSGLRLRLDLNPEPYPKFTGLEVFSLRAQDWILLGDLTDLEEDGRGCRVWPDPTSAISLGDYMDLNTGRVRFRLSNTGSDIDLERVLLDVRGTSRGP